MVSNKGVLGGVETHATPHPELYPEEIGIKDKIIDDFDYKTIDSDGGFNDDYKKAVEIVKNKDGCVYTMVDGDDGELVYLKGLHYVNRFGICILTHLREMKGGSKE